MARYIDADALLNKICKQFDIPDDWDGDIAEPLQTVIDIIDNFDVAYDVEAVVAELEKLKEEYEHHCIHGAWQRGAIDGAKIALSKAISIVRGKE